MFKTEVRGGQTVTLADVDDAATNKARAALAEFLSILGIYCPKDFMYTVVYESTSYNWVMDRLKTTYNLNTKGLGFLAASDLKFDSADDGQTHQQMYQALKEFYASALMKKGDKFEGKPLEENETLTPLAKNFIVEKWLDAIHPGLKSHVRTSRGALFNDDRPSLADNQAQLCEQMPQLLHELEATSSASVNRTSVTQQPPTQINRAGFPSQNRRINPPFRRQPQPARNWQPSAGARTSNRSNCPPDTCIRCYEANRKGPSSKTHFAASCPFNRKPQTSQQMRVLLIPADQQNYTDNYLPAQIQEIQLNNHLLQQGDIGQQGDDQDGAYGGDYEQEEDVNDYDFTQNKYPYNYEFVPPGFGYVIPTTPKNDSLAQKAPTMNLIPTRSIQKFTCLCNRKQAPIALDTGCEGDCMTEAEAIRLGIEILPLDLQDKIPSQADGSTTLEVVGAAITTFHRDGVILHFHGYVVKHLSQPILCGLPFIARNNIVQYISRNSMSIGSKVILEDPPFSPATTLPFNVGNLLHVQDIELNNLSQLHSLIEVGSKVPTALRQKLNKIHSHHKSVFDGDLQAGYNGKSGNFEVDFNFNNDLPPPPHKGTIPNYYNKEDAAVLQQKIEDLEKQNIVARVSDLGINLKYASPCMIRKKTSGKQLSKEQYQQLSVKEKSKLNRFVICMNKLCQHINKKPAAATKLEETINIVSSFQHVITADLTDSFYQRKIKRCKLPFMGFHSPYGDNYVLLRSPQGLINQSEELELLVKVVLKEGIQAGHIRVHADNIYVMGQTQEETIDRWEWVLQAMEENNLKLSPKKTAIFPDKLDLLGWTKEGKFLIPDAHRQNVLLTCSRPTTIKELRSFLGSYHTFYKCQENHNMILSPLTKILSQNPTSNQRIQWTPDLIQAFQRAQAAAKDLDKLYTPRPSDQLAVTSDYAEKGQNMEAGISATLWALVDDQWLVVARMSAEIQPLQNNLCPCDGEATASFVAAKTPTFRIPIKASLKKTLALVDSKPLMEAAKLLNQGKFSTSKIINNVLSSMSDLNLEFQHISGKLSKNCPDDFASRFPATCPNPHSCKLHSFVRECTSFSVARVSISVTLGQEGAMIGHIKQDDNLIKDILSGKTALPFNNKRAFAFLQSRDQDLARVRELLLAGQRPSEKRDFKPVKQFFRSDTRTTIDREGCLTVVKRNKQTLVTRELVVVPDTMSTGLLYSLHLNLKHPSCDQLHKVVDTRFFISDLANKCKQVTEECTPCTSIKSIPTEIYEYKQNVVPNHPGKSFTVDVLRECKKMVVVAADNFSGFISTAFTTSEKEVDLRDAIMKTVCPFMASSLSRVRVDRAPGFVKLSTMTESLSDLGIDMELGECKNKNALSIVDQKIKELRSAIKKISPSHTTLNQMTLTKATTVVNESIRHHDLSAKEIQFSRNQTNSDNIKLDDEEIKEKIEQHRTANNPHSSKAKSTSRLPAKSAGASLGQLVFIKNEGSKNKRRDLYIVIDVDKDSDMLIVCKVRDAISNKSASMVPHDPRYRYKVRQTDIILAPNQPPPPTVHDTIYVYEESDPATPGEDIEEETPKQHHIENDDFGNDEDIAWFEEARDPPTDEDDDNEVTVNGGAQQEDTDEDDDSEITVEEEEEDNLLFMPQLFNEEEDNYYDEEEEGENDDEEIVENNDEPNIPEPAMNLNQQPQPTTILSKLPTQGKYVKFKRQQVSQIDRDLYIPTERFLYAKITQTLKKDKFGRTYFNIRYPDHSTDGIYLARGELRPNDLIWEVVDEAEFFQHAHIQQNDGAQATPESLTPNTSPEQLPPLLRADSDPNLEWDHSPERLTEDEAFLWEEKPLKALAAQDIGNQDGSSGDSTGRHEQESTTTHPILRRQNAFRRKYKYKPGGYSLNSIPHPTNPNDVNLKTVTNLESVLDPEKPIVPEVVNLDVVQDLDLVLDKKP